MEDRLGDVLDLAREVGHLRRRRHDLGDKDASGWLRRRAGQLHALEETDQPLGAQQRIQHIALGAHRATRVRRGPHVLAVGVDVMQVEGGQIRGVRLVHRVPAEELAQPADLLVTETRAAALGLHSVAQVELGKRA